MESTVSNGNSEISDSVSAAKYALRELLLAKVALEDRREPIRSFRVAHRRFRRIHRAFERQTQALVSELTGMDVPGSEIAEILREVEQETLRRREFAH